MFSNEDLWHAIDILAKNNNFSASGLARAAGLDPTTFNKSKRKSKYGQPRWLSFDTLGKVLRTTNTSLSEFASYIKNAGSQS
ncbi:MAG: helix-turn-helix domain-containing protein [Alphaproteobacteria bacterium]